MIVQRIANSKNDEFYTPQYAIEPIIKYLKKNSTVWCPFDIQDSLFVKVLSNNGFKVINTHINNGEDFFNIKMYLGKLFGYMHKSLLDKLCKLPSVVCEYI